VQDGEEDNLGTVVKVSAPYFERSS
jgi:hypothetical protein